MTNRKRKKILSRHLDELVHVLNKADWHNDREITAIHARMGEAVTVCHLLGLSKFIERYLMELSE